MEDWWFMIYDKYTCFATSNMSPIAPYFNKRKLGFICNLASSQRILVVRDPSKILEDSKISRQF